MKYINLLFLCMIVLLSSCAQQSAPQKEQQVYIKSVKEYVESNEFINIIPEIDFASVSTRSAQEKTAIDYQSKAATYRFYTHCSQDEDGIITCHVKCGKDINISEELFQFRLKDTEAFNARLKKKLVEGKKVNVTRLGETYFNQLLNYK